MSNGAGRYLGRYILWILNRSPNQVGGWLTVGQGGALAFATESLPLDGSAYFDFFSRDADLGIPGYVSIQSAATGQYLLISGDDMVLANAPTISNAAIFAVGFVVDGSWEFDTPFPSNLSLFDAIWLDFVGAYVGLNTGPGSALQLTVELPAAASINMVGMKPAGASAGLQTRRAVRASGPRVPRKAASKPAGTQTADDPTPAFPYFAGKYAIAFSNGWLVPAGDGLALQQTMPSDGTCWFNVYRQSELYDPYAGNTIGVIFQTSTGMFLQMPAGAAPGPIGLAGTNTIPDVASAPIFTLWPVRAALGNYQQLIPNATGAFGNFGDSFQNLWPNQPTQPFGIDVLVPGPEAPSSVVSASDAWYEVSVLFVGGTSNQVLSASDYTQEWPPDAAILTRVVPGLRDMIAPGAQNWWDGADLRSVDMRTCLGFLTGPAAQWGNANLAFATLEGMDLTAISIGNAVDLSNARLAKVTWKAGQDLSQANLSGADLSGGVDLTAVTFGSANLNGANLTQALLTGLDLSQTTCAGTIFTGTDLTTTKLPTAAGALGQGSNGAVFERATVPIAQLGSDWRNLDVSTTNFQPFLPTTIGVITADNAKFHDTILDGLTITPDTNKNGASLQFADLTGASLRGASLQYANFSSALLYAAVLSNADLTATTWSNAFAGTKQYLFTLSPFASGDPDTLDGGSVPADLSAAFAANGHALQNPQVTVRSQSSAWTIVDGASTYTVNVAAVALDVLTAGRTSAQLAGACLANADLTGGSFAGVDFTGVQLTGSAKASGVDFEQADFAGANISSATANQPNLQGAYLYGANLANAFLFNANLQGAFLSGSIAAKPAMLTGAMLAGVTLTGALLDGTTMTNALVGLTPQGAPPNFAGGSATDPNAGVALFTLDAATFTPILNNGTNWGTYAPQQLQNVFSKNGISLSSPAFFTPYQGQALWDISLTDANLDPPPTPTTAGWVWSGFTIMQGQQQYQGTSDLVVYGTMLWMFAPDLQGALQAEPYIVAATKLSATDIVDTTFCPNSRTWETNKANGVPWEAAMMPATVTAPAISK